MVDVLGLDIGGANTKATYIKTEKGTVKEYRTAIEYFPIWKKCKQLPKILEKLKNIVTDPIVLDGVVVTITAELSDTYFTKKDGINQVLNSVTYIFEDTPTFVLNVEAELVTVEEARKEPLKVASANWAATGWMVAQHIKNCVVVDVGSTTTSIIPVINGTVAAEGKTDLEKLQNGELIYSGSLRTNVATIVDAVPVKGTLTRVSSELFAQSGDVHLILGNIREEEYTAETCDGRGKTVREALGRLARVVCADIDMLPEQEIVAMAKFVYGKQVDQISVGLKQIFERVKPCLQQKTVAVVTGLGRNFLAKNAAKKVGFKEVIDLGELVCAETALASPSTGVALMMATSLGGKTVKWKQS